MSKKCICRALIKPHSAKITSQIKRNSKRTCQLYVYTHEHELYKFMHLRADNNVIQLLLTILFCCARWCWRENWWKWAKWADSITVSIIKAAREMRRSPRATRVCPKFVSLSLASQEIGHMSNPTITWREAEETKKWAPNKRTHNKNYCVICISKYLLFSSSVNCCRTNDSFPLHSNRKKNKRWRFSTSWD